MKKGVHIFTKTKNTDGWKKNIWTFLENAQCFVGALHSRKIRQKKTSALNWDFKKIKKNIDETRKCFLEELKHDDLMSKKYKKTRRVWARAKEKLETYGCQQFINTWAVVTMAHYIHVHISHMSRTYITYDIYIYIYIYIIFITHCSLFIY